MDINFVAENYDCYALLILSHGNENGVLGTDNQSISYEEIMDRLKGDECPLMVGRPKLIFSQACRGVGFDAGQLFGRGGKDVVHDGQMTKQPVCRVPTDSDILLMCSTTQGRSAHKYTEYPKGYDAIAHSWFIEALQQVFTVHAQKEDLLSMLTKVNNHVAMMGNSEIGMQISCQFSTLTHKVYLSKCNNS